MSRHITVLEEEAVDALNLKGSAIAVDATANGGGHTRRIRERLGDGGLLISIDVDARACEALREVVREEGAPMRVICANFRTIASTLIHDGVSEVDAILADLGWSTNQFEGGGRGFSFNSNEPLLMTYGDPSSYPFTARDIVNRWNEEDIANVLYGYAEERASRKIAAAIVRAREEKPIETAQDLATIVGSVMAKRGRIHPATKTFQALRIAVNDEYGALREFLTGAFASLAPRGRLAIITFHSGEDRIVKEAFKQWANEEKGRLVFKKPLAPSREEVLKNPRARSAKLRCIEKL